MALNFLLRLRYDASSNSGVTDISGNYTITREGNKASSVASPFNDGTNGFFISSGNDGLNLDNPKELKFTKHTVCFWLKGSTNSCYLGNTILTGNPDRNGYSGLCFEVTHDTGLVRISFCSTGGYLDSTRSVYDNKWHFVEINTDGTLARIFIDGIKDKETTISNLSTFNLIKYATYPMSLGNLGLNSMNDSQGVSNLSLYDFCIIDGIWHTENYNVPTAYIQLAKQGLCISKFPINLLDKTSITGITTEGIQPTNTTRHVAFKVDDVWKKLTIASGGVATLTDLATQAITTESLASEGNTAAELANVTSVPGFVGKLVYPAIALYVSEEATAMPTFGLKVNTITDRNKNSITSPVYHISDTEITITDITINKMIVGDAGINIVASIKNSSGWSFYTDIDNIISKKATDIKFIYTFYVKECNEKNSARLIGITVKYDQDNPVMTLTGTFKISPLILCINEKENGLTHYKFNYVGRDNNSTNSVCRCFAKSLYELPQKAGGE